MPTGRKIWISGMYTLTQSSPRVSQVCPLGGRLGSRGCTHWLSPHLGYSRSDFVEVGAQVWPLGGRLGSRGCTHGLSPHPGYPRSDFVEVGAGHSSRTAQVLWLLSSLYTDPACPSSRLASLQVLTVTGVCVWMKGKSFCYISVHNSLLVRYWCQGLGVPWRKQVSGSQVNHFLCE